MSKYKGISKNITTGKIMINDRGALDYAIEARLEAALQRAGGI